jgi:hypothetical protein
MIKKVINVNREPFTVASDDLNPEKIYGFAYGHGVFILKFGWSHTEGMERGRWVRLDSSSSNEDRLLCSFNNKVTEMVEKYDIYEFDSLSEFLKWACNET